MSEPPRLPLYVSTSRRHGVGVFAARRFAAGDVLEVCPLIILSEEDRALFDRTALYDFYYDWNGRAALALGFGSLYNHSSEPNATYEKLFSDRTVVVRALQGIAANEEVTINYGTDSHGSHGLWFEPRE